MVERVRHELENVDKPPDLSLVVFGASGDLAARKLMPALESLCDHEALPEHFTLIGVARSAWTRRGVPRPRAQVYERLHMPSVGREVVSTVPLRFGRLRVARHVRRLKKVLDQRRRRARYRREHRLLPGNRPRHVRDRRDRTRKARLQCSQGQNGAFARLVIEKPFGRDLDSASALDATLHESFDESQIYRIDHYMGKETVQNVLALRFANAIFEPVWNRRFVDHIQITVAEQLGVEHRGGFYETAGALRDIVQNHVMQVLALTLMEPPVSIEATGIRDEKVKLLRAVEIPSPDAAIGSAVRGQYIAGEIDGAPVPGVPRGGGRRPAQHDRDVRGDEALGRQLAVGGRACLRPHGQSGSYKSGHRGRVCSSNRCPISHSATGWLATSAPTPWCSGSNPTRA